MEIIIAVIIIVFFFFSGMPLPQFTIINFTFFLLSFYHISLHFNGVCNCYIIIGRPDKYKIAVICTVYSVQLFQNISCAHALVDPMNNISGRKTVFWQAGGVKP